MKLKHFFMITLLMTIIFSIGCTSKYKKDFNTSKINEVMSALTVIDWQVEVFASTGLSKIYKTQAAAIHLENGYILALTHATKHKGFLKVPINTVYGTSYVAFPLDVGEYSFKVEGEEIKLVGRYEDISLFKGQNYSVPSVTWGDSDELEIGTQLIMLGNSGLLGINLKTGIVSLIDVSEAFVIDVTIEDEHNKVILTTIPTNPGDSGSPILAMTLHREYEIVGVSYATGTGDALGYMFKSNYVKDAIKRIRLGE